MGVAGQRLGLATSGLAPGPHTESKGASTQLHHSFVICFPISLLSDFCLCTVRYAFECKVEENIEVDLSVDDSSSSVPHVCR